MAISEKEIKTLARLARLDFSEEETAKFVPEFEEIIEFANSINGQVQGDTSSIREVTTRIAQLDELRADEVQESLPSEKVTSNVHSDNGYFAVRRVVK